VAGHDRQRGLGQLAIDGMQIGAADAASSDLDRDAAAAAAGTRRSSSSSGVRVRRSISARMAGSFVIVWA